MKPFFTAEDFPPDIMCEGHLCDATEFDHARFANTKVQPLLEEIERLKDELGTMSPQFDGFVKENLRLTFLASKLTEQNRIMKEALEFYLDQDEKHPEWLLVDRGDRAREALATVSALQKELGK